MSSKLKRRSRMNKIKIKVYEYNNPSFKSFIIGLNKSAGQIKLSEISTDDTENNDGK